MNESAELKKDYTDILSKIPDYFWQAFAGELSATFWMDISNLWMVKIYKSTAGWRMAFKITCKKLGLNWLWDSYNSLGWEEWDLFDDELLDILKQKLCQFRIQDTNPYWLWLNIEYTWMKG